MFHGKPPQDLNFNYAITNLHNVHNKVKFSKLLSLLKNTAVNSKSAFVLSEILICILKGFAMFLALF